MLRKSAVDKLNDLRERFYDKVGELNEESKAGFETLFGSIKEGVELYHPLGPRFGRTAINAVPAVR